MDEDRCGEDREDFSPLLLKEGVSGNCSTTVVRSVVPRLHKLASNSLQESCSIPSLNCATYNFSKSPLTATTITNQPELEDAEISIGDCIIEKQDEFVPDLSQRDVCSSLIVLQAQQQTSQLSATPNKVTDIQTVASPIHCKDTSNCGCCPVSSANFLPKSNRKCSIRYLILLLSILCMTATRSNDLSFNFTVICMTSNSSLNNDFLIHMKPRELSAIFAGGGIGAIAMVLPIVYALHYFGPRLVFGTLLLLSASATFALPSLAKLSPLWMVPARIVQGLALSAVLPLMGCISAEWAPLSEIGKFMTLLSSAGQLSQILTMPLSAQLCVTSGWSSVFYAHGIISALLAGCFLFFYRSSPRKHPCVNAKELHYITQGAKAKNKKERRVPYKQILKSKAVWAIWVAFLGNSFGFQLIIQFMPTFLNKVLNVPIARTGMVAIIPPVTQLLVKVLAGYASDNITFISELTKLRFFNSMAMVGCGLFLLPLGFLSEGSDSMIPAMFCFTGSISCLGMVACSSMKSATLVARNFTHFVMGVVQLVVCVAILAIPVFVSFLAPSNAIREWRSVFFLVFFILLFSNIFFCCFCSANPEVWALPITPQSLLNDLHNNLGENEKRNIGRNTTDIAPTTTINSSKYIENLAEPSDI